jgi:carboxyl-terminal processing protease
MVRPRLFLLLSLLLGYLGAATPPLKPWDVTTFFEGVRHAHARAEKGLTPELAQRILANYLDLIDPWRTYLLAEEANQWLKCSPEVLNQVCQCYNKWQFPHFEQIDRLMVAGIERRAAWTPSEKRLEEPPKKIETKLPDWATSQDELTRRWQLAHQRMEQMATKLSSDGLEARMARRRNQWEGQWTSLDGEERERRRLVRILKASASSLDDHTVYLTPQEARSLQIDMEQRLVGIGVQLRDDLELGFTVMRLLENGPAERSGEVQVGDRIAAVNGDNVVGLEIEAVVEKIRGRSGSPVQMTLLRTVEGNLQSLDVTLVRDEVLFEGKQCELRAHPFGSGLIGHIALHSFYGDHNTDRCSTKDVEEALTSLSEKGELLGVVLDLRQNGGGLLGEALQVAALFLPQGAGVVVKDSSGELNQVHSRAQKPIYEGPLLVLTSRASASGAEIVAQALQEQGRALVVGDEQTFGKGSYQVLSTQLIGRNKIDPKGEFKVTRGCYYTLTGRTPQLEGVVADLVVPSPLAQVEVGERWSRYPLAPEPIELPADLLRASVAQPQQWNLERLRANSRLRLEAHPSYANLVKEAASREERDRADHLLDLQLEEAFSIMKDLIVLRDDP